VILPISEILNQKDQPKFFSQPSDLRKWFEEHHDQAHEIWVGYYKKGSGIRSITWPESVDQALCYGWIDGIRKSIDEASYKIRFTPRRPRSQWSAVNLKRIEELKAQGLVSASGLKVYERRDKKRARQASFEQREVVLNRAYLNEIKSNKKAWSFYQTLAPSYKKATSWWIMSAKKEETRLRRLDILIQSCTEEQKVPPLRRNPK